MTDKLRERLFLAAVSTITLGSAVLSAMFGWSLSNYTIVAAILAAVGAAVCVIWSVVPIAARRFWDNGQYVSVGMVALLGILAGTFDVTSNFGSISWQRGENIQTARIQNTVYEDRRETVKEAKAKLTFFEKHLADLKAKQAWAGTKPPSAFDSQIEAARLAVDLEAKRGGCGPICERKRFELASLEAQRAMAVRYADLEKQIAATKRILHDARNTAAVTKPGESGALMQTTALASVWTLSLNPDETSIGWTERGIGWLIALFLCIAPALANYVWAYGIGSGPKAKEITNPPAARAHSAPALLPAADTTSYAHTAPAGGANHMMAAVLQHGEDPFDALRKIASQMQIKEATA